VAWLKRMLMALLFSLLFGLAIGTALRLRLERPVVYMGSATPCFPLDIGHAGAAIFDPCHHEQKIG
jgi:hypothetical protein